MSRRSTVFAALLFAAVCLQATPRSHAGESHDRWPGLPAGVFESPPEVVCPALWEGYFPWNDADDGYAYPFGRHWTGGLGSLVFDLELRRHFPVELVVVGTLLDEPASQPASVNGEPALTLWPRDFSEASLRSIRVERTLFGSRAGAVLRCHIREEKRAKGWMGVFLLRPTSWSRAIPYDVCLSFEADEEDALAVVAAARFDYRVLSATHIVVGAQRSIAKRAITVEVDRMIHGSVDTADKLLHVAVGDVEPCQDGIPGDETLIYLLRSCVDRRPTKPEPWFVLQARMSLDQEPQVLDALKRRDSYPVVGTDSSSDTADKARPSSGPASKWWGLRRETPSSGRQIGFLGSVDQAIRLVGSNSRAAVDLGMDRLLREKACLPQVVAAIEEDLVSQTPRGSAGFNRLSGLIDLLPPFSENRPDGAAGALVTRLLDHIASHPAELPSARKKDWYCSTQHECDKVSSNHALAWLCQTLDPEIVATRYGPRLAELHEVAQGHWRDEIQLATDVCSISDRIAVNAVLGRMAGVEPLCSRLSQGVTGQIAPARMIAFSDDGKRLRGVCGDGTAVVWDTSTLERIAWGPLPDHFRVVSSRADGKYLLACRIDDPSGGLTVIDGDTGRQVTSLEIPMDYMRSIGFAVCAKFVWCNATEAVVFGTGMLCRFNYVTGDILSRFDTARTDHCPSCGGLAKDGKVLIAVAGGGKGEELSVVEIDLATGRSSDPRVLSSPPHAGCNPGVVPGGDLIYSDDPAYFLCNRVTGEILVNGGDGHRRSKQVAFTRDATRWAGILSGRDFLDWFSGSRGDEPRALIRVYETLTGRLLYAFRTKAVDANGLAFSPDGHRIAVACDDGSIELWDLP